MQSCELHSFTCELLINLTACYTFSDLDDTLVKSACQLSGHQYANLYIGDYGDSEKLLLSTYSINSTDNPEQVKNPYIIPIKLSAEKMLNLVLSVTPSKDHCDEIAKLITTYSNVHNHLNRANKDQLTGLKNRRAFDDEYERLSLEKPNTHEGHYSNVLAVVDVDFFKQVNDQYGHLIGDETLIAISNIMKDFFQRDDFLYRFGGEEFILLLKQIPLHKAEDLLEELRKNIETHCFPQIGNLTISIGYIELVTGIDKNLLFERADAALYQAKESGRNCLKSYEKLVAEHAIEPLMPREGEIELF